MLTVDGDSVRLFHQTLMEFLMQASSPYFVNPGQGAARLLSFVGEDAAYARLDPPLKMFCQQNFEDWILQCRDLKDYSFNLTQLYDQFCFSRPTEALPYYVCGVNVSERDRQVVEHLMNTGLAESTVSIIALAFTRATERFRSGGPELWIREPGRLAPDEVTARTISRGINMSFEFARKGLAWTQLLGRIAPQMRPRLLQILKDNDASGLHWVFGWLDIAVGYHVLGISRYFEDQASAIRSDWTDIENELQSKGPAA